MRKVHGSDGNRETEINISPLIDMVFILLIFFIVTTVFIEEEGLHTNTPDSDTELPTADEEPFIIAIREGGGVFFEGREIGTQGISSRIRDARSRGLLASVIVEVHSEASVAKTVAVLDLCKGEGVERLSMRTESP